MNLGGNLRVWPFVGFVRASASDGKLIADMDPLPSIDIDALRRGASRPEVATVFHLPLAALTAPARMRSYMFRGSRPYWAIDVTDLVSTAEEGNEVDDIAEQTDLYVGELESQAPRAPQQDEVGTGKDDRMEVWGLTGWYLSLLMRALKVYK